jgi:hypothetical protein
LIHFCVARRGLNKAKTAKLMQTAFVAETRSIRIHIANMPSDKGSSVMGRAAAFLFGRGFLPLLRAFERLMAMAFAGSQWIIAGTLLQYRGLLGREAMPFANSPRLSSRQLAVPPLRAFRQRCKTCGGSR